MSGKIEKIVINGKSFNVGSSNPLIGYGVLSCSQCGNPEDIEDLKEMEIELENGKKYKLIWCKYCLFKFMQYIEPVEEAGK